MELGPFAISEIESIKALFESKQVPYEILIDQVAEAQFLAELGAESKQAPASMGGKLDLKIMYFEIAESDFEKVEQGLEKYGIMAVSDGSYELGED